MKIGKNEPPQFKIRQLMNWLLFFIPSWRFFDRSGYTPKLRIFIKNTNIEISFIPPQIHPIRFLFNPFGNEFLFKITCVQRFIENLRQFSELSSTDIEALPSFQFLLELIQLEIQKKYPGPQLFHFEIDILTESTQDLFFKSEVYQCQ